MDSSASTPTRSVMSTPVPPTPPPLPTDLFSFLAAQEPSPISPAPSQKGFTPSCQAPSRTAPFTERHAGLHPTRAVLTFSQPTPPPPPPLPPPTHHSSFTFSLPDAPLQCNSDRGPHTAEAAKCGFIKKPNVYSCSDSAAGQSSTQRPEQRNSDTCENKSIKMPDIELYVKDPYDDLFMVLGGSSRADDGDISKVLSLDSPPDKLAESQSKWYQNKDQQSHQPAVKPAAEAEVSDSPGNVRLKVQFHKPLTVKPQPDLWGEQSLSKDADAQRLPSAEGMGYTELFIEEEDEELKDKEEDTRGLNYRLSPPQVESMV